MVVLLFTSSALYPRLLALSRKSGLYLHLLCRAGRSCHFIVRSGLSVSLWTGHLFLDGLAADCPRLYVRVFQQFTPFYMTHNQAMMSEMFALAKAIKGFAPKKLKR